MDFGTGVVKITPAHDPNDFEVGLRHNLPVINVMTDDAKITEDYPKYAGMDRYEARKAIVADLEAEGALLRVEDYNHNVGTCYRCGTTVEPRVSKQWFVKMKPLAQPAIDAVKTGETKFVPSHFEKTYFHWLENIRDWCISRQLWWGHQIPAFYCDDCGEMVVTKDNHATCPKCGKEMRQDPDTLDTWFSSALWPFSTLGWPENTEELNYFYPTNTLVTGYDIIPFWVMRMMFSGIEHTGKVPFDTVLIHGLVRDSQGRKMSKSLGNGIDPLEIINKYGADALRLTLATGNAPGNDMRFYDERVEFSSNFANKLWNAARFVHMNIDEHNVENKLPAELATEDKWIISTLNNVAKEVTENLDKFELGIAVQKVFDFIWDCYCDWYIELAKSRLQSTGESAQNARQVLVWVLDNALRLLHPFMPFITEEIWQTLPHQGDTIMLAKYPEFTSEYDFPQAREEMEVVMNGIRAIRTRRSEMNVPPSRKAKVYIATDQKTVFENGAPFICKLASASEVEVGDSFDIDGAVTVITAEAKIYIPMSELVDKEEELQRLNKELAKTEKMLAQSEGKLNNQGFIGKAPANVVEKVKQQAEKEREKIAMIKAAIDALK
ncbi:MAG: valine--tRNA ligase, partial [Clostridia bacterium]|nr:valine--tRNA ligase [Clostridia bacterium]